MKISISNIAWKKKQDKKMYEYISKSKLQGIEIAPTRIIEKNPYDKIHKAIEFKNKMKYLYQLEISSMQSIWYGRQENIFQKEEAYKLLSYTKKAIDFASRIHCKNIVFGCPKNRNMPENRKEQDVFEFFKELGEYAKNKGTILAIEPNPTIYGTNFINTTQQAFEFVNKIESEGIKVNVDLGTILQNKEELNVVWNHMDLVNHFHISEPNLSKIQKREEHKKLAEFLKSINYQQYVSIEMKKTEHLKEVKKVIEYITGIFG